VADLWLSTNMAVRVGRCWHWSPRRALGFGVVSIGIVGCPMLHQALRSAGFSKRDLQRVLVSGAALADCGAWYLTSADSDV